MEKIRNICLCIFILSVYILTAVHSNGYHHPDEHFQLIEFAGLQAGWNYGFNLAWEYGAQIRPALQPMIAACMFKALNLFGVTDPLLLSMALRLLTAVLSLICIGIFVKSFLPSVQTGYRTAFILFSYLLWFLPAVNVRFSSESWAGLTLLPAVSIIYSGKNGKNGNVMAGILLGLSFVFRFQMATAILGLLLWLIIIRKEKIKDILYLLSGITAVVIAGTAIDSWFYENFVFTPWNYFKVNIVYDVASQFGVSPWFFYFREILMRPTLFIGLIILLSMLVLLLYTYKHILLWCIVPFMLVHSLIPHKELRFLFPVVNFVPLIVILAFQTVKSICRERFNTAFVPLLIIAAFVNTGGLAMMSFKPAMYGNVNMIKHIKKHCTGQVNLYTIAYSNPYSEGLLSARFYSNPQVQFHGLSEILDNFSERQFSKHDLIILQSGYSERHQVESAGFTVKARSIPLWIEKMNYLYRVYPEDQTLLLYQCDK
jgi:phosphatidylinositol glycan class B